MMSDQTQSGKGGSRSCSTYGEMVFLDFAKNLRGSD